MKVPRGGRAEKKPDHFNIPLIGKLVYFSEGICKFKDQGSSKCLYFFDMECQSKYQEASKSQKM